MLKDLRIRDYVHMADVPVVDVASVRAYLDAVYPAAAASLARLYPHELVRLYDSLDYYYTFSPNARSTIRPLHTIDLHRWPVLPYLPMGAYYQARGRIPLDRGRLNAIMWGSFHRHAEPVSLVPRRRSSEQVEDFRSSFGARLGPQPSWTSPFAIVRYVHFPNGLELWPPSLHPTKAHASSSNGFFDVSLDLQHSRRNVFNASVHAGDDANSASASKLPHMLALRVDTISRLRHLRDGDFVEVEQWGGMLGAEECPPICGLWANIWRGTGVMLRVSQPFVSLSKATAIVQMIERVSARNTSAFTELLDQLRAAAPVRAQQDRHPTAPLWTCLVAYVFSKLPCAGAMRGEQYDSIASRWSEIARRSAPEAIAQWVLQLGSASSEQPFSSGERFALYWTMAICGKGQKSTPFWAESPVGPDGLLGALACILGHRTIVLLASANDNGLLHQELVDFELPSPHGWQSPQSGVTNDVRYCLTLQSFAFVAEDQRSGAEAKVQRRRQMLEFWRMSGKFAVPTDPTTLITRASAPVVPCQISFGNGTASGTLLACTGPKRRTQPTATKACWAHCNGTLSRTVLAAASLGHMIVREHLH